MKKFFPYILILVIMVGILVPTEITYAEGSWLGSITSFTVGAVASLISPVFWIIQKMTAFLMGLSGLLLNKILQVTIIEMSQNINGVNGVGGMTGINTAWKLLRDLMNIVFIFLLLYEGIMMIIGNSSIEKVRKFVFGIVMSALLINFSLFFTKVIIDASNIVTIGMYKSILGPERIQKGEGLSNVVMSQLGLTSVFSTIDFDSTVNSSNSYGPMLGNLGSAILFLVTAFVFLAVSVLFIVRYIVLVILMALSPIAYMGMALSDVSSSAKDWWNTFWGQIIFPPVFMIMIWIVMIIIGSQDFFGAKGANFSGLGKAATEADVANSANLILNFVMVIGLMIAALVTSKKYANQGSKYVGKLSSSATTLAGGALFGGAAWAGRTSLGRMALKNTDIDELERRSAEGSVGAKARLALAKGSFDARRSYAGEKIQDTTGVDMGKGIPFKEKAGVGGRAATVADYRKDKNEDLDTIVGEYSKKRQWDKLADFMVNGKPKLTSQSEWEERQKYIYKKLSGRDRISFEKALKSTSPTTAPALIKKLRSKLPIDDEIKMYTDNKEWDDMADWLFTKADGKPRTELDQNYIYEKMSPRDRVALDEALDNYDRTRGGTAGATAKTRMNSLLSIEDQDKTKESTRKVKKSKIQDAILDNIENFASGGILPAGIILDTEIKKLSPKEARNLSQAALMTQQVIESLSGQQLADIVANSDVIDDSIKTYIVSVIENPAATHTMKAKQHKYLHQNPATEALWGI